MTVGDPVSETIRSALKNVYCMVVVLTPDALKSAWVTAEIREAVALAEAGRLRILPLLLADCEIPTCLVKLNYADFRAWPRRGTTRTARAFRPHRVRST